MGDLTLRAAGGSLVLTGGNATLRLGHNGGSASMGMFLGVGPAGPPGPPGPGVGDIALDTDGVPFFDPAAAAGGPSNTAVAGYVGASGATQTALDARYSKKGGGGGVFPVKDQANYVAGADNTAAIASAMDAASAAGGGIVLLPVGTTIGYARVKSFCTLTGAGRASTLQLPDNANAHVVALYDGATEHTTIRDLIVDGNKYNGNFSGADGINYANNKGTTGIPFPSGVGPRHTLENVLVKNVRRDGVHWGNDSLGGGNVSSNVEVYHAERYGWFDSTPDSNHSNIDVGQSGLVGFWLAGANSRYSNLKAWYSGRVDPTNGYGYQIETARVQVIGAEAQDNKNHGFYLTARANNCILANAYADSNGTAVTPTGNGVGFLVSGVGSSVRGAAIQRPIVGDVTAYFQTAGVKFVKDGSNPDPTGNMVDLISVLPATAPGEGISGSVGANYVHVVASGGTSANYSFTQALMPATVGSPVTNGEATMLRESAAGGSLALTSGVLQLTFFTARKTETTAQVRTITRGTAAAGLTLAKVGIYEVGASNQLTLVASTSNDTTQWATAFTRYTRTLTASFRKRAGVRYAVGLLAVGTTGPTMYGVSSIGAGEPDEDPRQAAQLAGQTDLPASITSAQLASNTQVIYSAVTP